MVDLPIDSAAGSSTTLSRTKSSLDSTRSGKSACPVREIKLHPHRVFINHLDGYNVKNLIDILVTSEYERSLVEAREEQELSKNEEGEKEKDKEERKIGSPGHSFGGGYRKYDIIGTVKNREVTCIEGARIIPSPSENREKYLHEIMKCEFLIFDITSEPPPIDEALWTLDKIILYLTELQKAKPRAFASSQDIRNFILVSSVMTWARTKPLNESLTESHYRKRKAHVNFREQLQCEKTVFSVKKQPNIGRKLRTAIVCAGVTYGQSEDLLEFAFKLGWLNETHLPVVSEGDNLVPLLHVRDLAAAVFAVMKEWPHQSYVVAVERKLTTQKKIIQAVSRALTTGKIKHIGMAEASRYSDLTSRVLDAITINLNLQPAFLTRSNFMSWHSKLSFVENIDELVTEFIESRNLHPLRIIVLGPPASGKSMIAQELANHYKLHYIVIKKLIPETVQQLKNQIDYAKEFTEEFEEDEEAEDNQTVAENKLDLSFCEELLKEILTGLAENNGRLDDDTLTKIFRFKLLSRPCRNQGYVIDGYPKTMDQATMLFTSNNYDKEQNLESERKGGGDDEGESNLTADEFITILPDIVIGFDAGDDFLINRVNELSEKEINIKHYSEDNMLRRLLDYRERNIEDNSPLQLFDELEIHPIILNVEEDTSPSMISTFQYCLSVIGETHNYGKSIEELTEEKRQADELEASNRVKEAAEKERINAELRKEKEKKAEQWTNLMEQLKAEEEHQLALEAEPLRHYLIKNVFPTLTKGLVTIAKLRPEDPVDFLAEYLIKENPEARVFEPDYTEAVDSTLSKLKIFQCEGMLPSLPDDAYEHSQNNDETPKPSSLQSEEKYECCWCSLISCEEAEEDSVNTCTFSNSDVRSVKLPTPRVSSDMVSVTRTMSEYPVSNTEYKIDYNRSKSAPDPKSSQTRLFGGAQATEIPVSRPKISDGGSSGESPPFIGPLPLLTELMDVAGPVTEFIGDPRTRAVASEIRLAIGFTEDHDDAEVQTSRIVSSAEDIQANSHFSTEVVEAVLTVGSQRSESTRDEVSSTRIIDAAGISTMTTNEDVLAGSHSTLDSVEVVVKVDSQKSESTLAAVSSTSSITAAEISPVTPGKDILTDSHFTLEDDGAMMKVDSQRSESTEATVKSSATKSIIVITESTNGSTASEVIITNKLTDDYTDHEVNAETNSARSKISITEKADTQRCVSITNRALSIDRWDKNPVDLEVAVTESSKTESIVAISQSIDTHSDGSKITQCESIFDVAREYNDREPETQMSIASLSDEDNQSTENTVPEKKTWCINIIEQ